MNRQEAIAARWSEKIEPLEDQVLVMVDEAEKVTSGGLLLPDMAQEKPLRGRVLAVGPGKQNFNGIREKISVQVGDQVFFQKYAGRDISWQGEDLTFITANQLVARIVKEE